VSEKREDFQVDSRSGMIKLAAHLDYEKETEYKFNVTVMNVGTPRLSDTATVGNLV
jgi:hypothetical protein